MFLSVSLKNAEISVEQGDFSFPEMFERRSYFASRFSMKKHLNSQGLGFNSRQDFLKLF